MTAQEVQGGEIELYLCPGYKNYFNQINTKFGELSHTIIPYIAGDIPSLKEVKTSLGTRFHESKPYLSTAELFDDVIELIKKKCTITNIAWFETNVDHCNIEKVRPHISAYKSAVDEICVKFKRNVLENENIMTASTSFKYESITFVLGWQQTDDLTLDDIYGLLWKAFGDMAKKIVPKYGLKRDTGNVYWRHDYASVSIMSPSTEQCKNIVSRLKQEQKEKKWRIELRSSTTDNALILISNLDQFVVEELSIEDTSLDSMCMSMLSEKFIKMKKLLFKSSSLPTGSIKQISDVLAHTDTSLEGFFLWNVPITDDDVNCLSEVLSNAKTLKTLEISNCDITDKGVQYICEGVAKNQTLTFLSISNNLQITSRSTDAIVELIKMTTSLKELYLRNTSLKYNDIMRICEELIKNTTIQQLVLSKQHENTCKLFPSLKDRLYFVIDKQDYPIMENIDCYTTVTVPEVAVTTLIEGQFEFPQKTKLVSAVHIITVSKPLLEPYKLEIQHCVKLVTQAQVNSLHFVRAPYSLTILPYQFTLIEGGQFNPGSRHGIIDIICQSTCFVAIVADQKQKTKDTDEENYIINQDTSGGITPLLSFVYTGVINYEEKDDKWIATLSVMKDLESLLKFVKRSSDTEDSIYFDFVDENGFIELVFQQEQFPGWSIKPMIEPCKLWQTDIDKFGSSPSTTVSSCQFLIHADDSPDTIGYLVYPVELKGITPPMNITIHRKKSGGLKHPVQIIDHQYLQEAIKKGGKIKASVSKVLVQGPARVGKTSVKCLILAQHYNKQDSTGVAERPQVAVGDFSMQTYGQNEEKKWELISDTNIVEMFANDIKSLMEKDNANSRTQSNEHNNSKKGDSGVHDNHMEVQQQDVEQDVSETHLDVADHPLSHGSSSDNNNLAGHNENGGDDDMSLCPEISLEYNPSPQLTETRRDDLAKQLSSLLNKASSRPDKLTLYKDWLYFIDSGGQIQFQQILQAFIPCVSVLMLVINLAQDLSSESSAELHCEDGKKYSVSEYSLQVETLLRRLTSMITFRNYKQQNDMTSEGSRRLSSAIKPPDRLKVITIATHEDKCEFGQVNEVIAHKVDQLKQIFQSVSDNLLYQNPTTGELLFKVDGRKASDTEETFDDELKSTISDIRNELSKQAFKVDVPLTWYAYEILLRDSTSISCGVLTVEECMTLGIDLGLEDDEIQPVLRFFSLLNSILYYPKEVTNLVFIDPHSLIEVVNELMVFVCKVRNGVDIGPGTLAGPDMAYFGIISSDVFSHEEHFKKFHEISNAVINLKSEETIDFKLHLFSIFTHLLLAIKLPDSKPPNEKYFMPALLPLTDPLNAIPFESSNNTPLLFYFRNGVPVGLFCAMVVNLLSTKLNNKFLWSLDKSTSKIYSNYILLRSKCLLGEVTLVESSDWFGICCECPADQLKVKEAIENAIAKTKKKRKIEVEWEIAFFCPCGQQPRHHAFLKHHYSMLFCELIKSPYGVCIQSTKDFPHFSWISLKSNQDKRPELCCLIELLAPISSNWGLIGGKLGVDIQIIDDLNKSDEMKLDEVIQKWIETKSTPSLWFNIIEIVKGQCPDIASTIKKYLDHFFNEQEQEKIQDTRPEKCVLLTLLPPIYHLWHELGDLLGVDSGTIQSLSTSQCSNLVKMSDILQSWLDNEPTPVTWNNIIDMIEGPLQNKRFADEIREKVKSNTIKSSKMNFKIPVELQRSVHGKRKSEGKDSDEDTLYQKQQAYDHSTSSDEESRSSSRCGKKPAGVRYYTKKSKQKRRYKKFKGHKRQRSGDSNSDGHNSFRKRKAYSKGSDSSLDSN